MKKNSTREKIKDILFLHGILLIYSLTGILSKFASKEDFLSSKFIILYGGMIFILMVYAVLWQQAIKRLPLMVAYANKAITVIWGIIWGKLIFNEKISAFNVIGAVIIICGVVYMLDEREEDKI